MRDFIKFFFIGVAAAFGWGFITNPVGTTAGCGCLSIILIVVALFLIGTVVNIFSGLLGFVIFVAIGLSVYFIWVSTQNKKESIKEIEMTVFNHKKRMEEKYGRGNDENYIQ